MYDEYFTDDLYYLKPNEANQSLESLVSSENWQSLPDIGRIFSEDGVGDQCLPDTTTLEDIEISGNSFNGCQYTDDIDELASDLDSRYWESKPPIQWTSADVWYWICSWTGDRSIDIEEVLPLTYSNMTGHDLCQMSRIDFVNFNQTYGGHMFETLQQLSAQFRKLWAFAF